ncbi:hypothetical protein, partial [Bradyrhizobium sp.]|uniref:hypothetical protein n=1 Tax=Bradyrhizobium sp. TaxID=376 RepID=UPI00345AA698
PIALQPNNMGRLPQAIGPYRHDQRLLRHAGFGSLAEMRAACTPLVIQHRILGERDFLLRREFDLIVSHRFDGSFSLAEIGTAAADAHMMMTMSGLSRSDGVNDGSHAGRCDQCLDHGMFHLLFLNRIQRDCGICGTIIRCSRHRSE